MRGTDNRAPNVIATVLVSYLVGLPAACCIGAGLNELAGRGRLGLVLILATVAGALIVPGCAAYWWNYRRRSPTDMRPWV